MSILHHLKQITININLAIKVFLMERLHRDLATATILHLVRIGAERQVVLDRLARVRGLFILAGGEGGCEGPVGGEDGDGGKDGEENTEFEAAADFPGEVERDQGDGGEEEGIGEGVVACSIGREGSVLYRRILECIR